MGKIYSPEVDVSDTQDGIAYMAWFVSDGLIRTGPEARYPTIPAAIYGMWEPAYARIGQPTNEQIRFQGAAFTGKITSLEKYVYRPNSSHYDVITIHAESNGFGYSPYPRTDSNYLYSDGAVFPDSFRIYKIVRRDGQPFVRCSDDSCKVACETSQDGFCCIDHSLTNSILGLITS